MHVYLRDAADFAAMNEAYAPFFPVEPPTRTTVVAPPAARSALIAISAIVIPDGEPRDVVHPAGWPPSRHPYSYAIRSGDTLWLAGLVARRGRDGTAVEGDVGVQTRAILDNARELLAAAGFGVGDVVSGRVYLPDARRFSGDERRLSRGVRRRLAAVARDRGGRPDAGVAAGRDHLRGRPRSEPHGDRTGRPAAVQPGDRRRWAPVRRRHARQRARRAHRQRRRDARDRHPGRPDAGPGRARLGGCPRSADLRHRARRRRERAGRAGAGPSRRPAGRERRAVGARRARCHRRNHGDRREECRRARETSPGRADRRGGVGGGARPRGRRAAGSATPLRRPRSRPSRWRRRAGPRPPPPSTAAPPGSSCASRTRRGRRSIAPSTTIRTVRSATGAWRWRSSRTRRRKCPPRWPLRRPRSGGPSPSPRRRRSSAPRSPRCARSAIVSRRRASPRPGRRAAPPIAMPCVPARRPIVASACGAPGRWPMPRRPCLTGMPCPRCCRPCRMRCRTSSSSTRERALDVGEAVIVLEVAADPRAPIVSRAMAAIAQADPPAAWPHERAADMAIRRGDWTAAAAASAKAGAAAREASARARAVDAELEALMQLGRRREAYARAGDAMRRLSDAPAARRRRGRADLRAHGHRRSPHRRPRAR